MTDISVLQLQESERDDCTRKNEFIACSKGEWIAILNKDKFSEQELLDRIREKDALVQGDIVAVCAGCSSDVMLLELKDLLGLFTLPIEALVFRRELLRESGGYNGKLQALTDYELLCRMTEINGNCLLLFDRDDEETRGTGETGCAFTWAYMIRRYLHVLHTYGITEQVLVQLYDTARQWGILFDLQENLNEMLKSGETYESVAAVNAPYVIFRGDDTCHGVLRDFADSLAESFWNRGQAAILAEPGKTDYDRLMQYPCKGLIGFQSAAFGIPYFRDLKGMKMQFWLDNPIFYKEQISTLPPDCYLLCQDGNYVEFIQKHYHREHVLHFPPGGHEQNLQEEEERIYDIIFIGGYTAEDTMPPEDFEKAYYEHMLRHPEQTFSQGLEQTLTACGIPLDAQGIEDLFPAMKLICQRIVNHFRKEVIETILQAGYRIHVYGDSWDAYESPYTERLIRHPEVTVEESLQEWRKAKIGLNIMSWHKAGMTERIANIMLAGAVCLSDETVYLKDNLKEEEEIVLYRLDKLERLPGQISKLLADEQYRKSIAQKGYEKARKEFSWDARAGQLMEMMTAVLRNESFSQ